MAELTRRYIVMQMATDGPFDMTDPDAPFVLKPWKDPAALHALAAYRDRCYAELAHEIDQWITAIEKGPVMRGDIGQRNESVAAARRPPAARRRAKVKAKLSTRKSWKKKVKRRS
jgi:hypothetical protein